MLTIFTIPRPFHNQFNLIQRNAIQSWNKLYPKCEIILFGDEEGTAKIAKELRVHHIPEIARNEFGTPLINNIFTKAQKITNCQKMAYVNADIILMSDFIKTLQSIKEPSFLMTSQRWDLDIKGPIQFDEVDWEDKLREKIAKEGKLHGPGAVDYFVFPSNFQHDLPAFTVGRLVWDNWFIYRFKSLQIPIIDTTRVVTVVHQNHRHSQKSNNFFEIEKQRNIKLAGGFSHMCTLRDADWILTPEGLKKPKFPRRIFTELSLFYPWRLLLSINRRLQLKKFLKQFLKCLKKP